MISLFEPKSNQDFYEKFDASTSSALRFLNGMKLTTGLSAVAWLTTLRPHASMLERAVEAGTAIVLSLAASHLSDKTRSAIYDALDQGPKFCERYADEYSEKCDKIRSSLFVSPLTLQIGGILMFARHTKGDTHAIPSEVAFAPVFLNIENAAYAQRTHKFVKALRHNILDRRPELKPNSGSSATQIFIA